MRLFLAQSGWSAQDSQNLQDLHDWVSQALDPVGFGWGIGTALTFGVGMFVFRYLKRVFNQAGGSGSDGDS